MEMLQQKRTLRGRVWVNSAVSETRIELYLSLGKLATERCQAYRELFRGRAVNHKRQVGGDDLRRVRSSLSRLLSRLRYGT